MTTNELREAAQRLAGNAGGLSAFEPEVRAIIGNTNWQAIVDCVADVDAALTATTNEPITTVMGLPVYEAAAQAEVCDDK